MEISGRPTRGGLNEQNTVTVHQRAKASIPVFVLKWAGSAPLANSVRPFPGCEMGTLMLAVQSPLRNLYSLQR